MPLLRKTGVRSPWLPGPLNGSAAPSVDALRQTVVIGAIVPALLLGNVTQFVGRPALPEDVNWPARPALIVTGSVPVPGASLWMPTPARVPNADPLRPPIDLQGSVPIPGAPIWAPYPVREIAGALPDRLASTQVISGWAPRPGGGALSVGRITATPIDRVPIATRASAPPVPIPGAIVLPIGIAHDGDRLPLGAKIQGPGVPIPGASAVSIGAVHPTPTDPIRPALVLVNQPPVPGGVGGLLRPPAKPAYIAVATTADRIVLVGFNLRGMQIAVDVRTATVAEARRVQVADEMRIVIIAVEDRDGAP